MLTLTTWTTPASAYPDHELGRARIKTTRYRGTYECYGLRGHRLYEARNIKVKRLLIANRGWMVDDPPHWWAMEEHAQFYHGHVLCAGLGLGLMVHTLSANPEVTRITVVEREKDVIDLVAPLVPQDKLHVVHGDFWEYRGRQPDGVLFDLFVGDGRQLQHDALVCYAQLAQWFDRATIRIHGFNNKALAEIGDAIRATRREYESDIANRRSGTDRGRVLRDCRRRA